MARPAAPRRQALVIAIDAIAIAIVIAIDAIAIAIAIGIAIDAIAIAIVDFDDSRAELLAHRRRSRRPR
ncbi:MAG: hypothetical protein M0004_01810 [Actinomycetota bacterium]|nr:hypothetical protein [Actinomycetota bacterium]